MPAIALRNLDYSSTGLLRVSLVSDTYEKELHFALPEGTALHPDAVLASLGMLLARSHDLIDIDFDVSDEMRSAVSMHCRAHLRGSNSVPPEDPVSEGPTGLAFSGGFDSITAKDMLPDDTQLVSLDFGGRFARERPMFEAYDSHIVETNLVTLGLNQYSWAFMGIANRLLRNSLKLKTMSFGTILEAREKYILRFKAQGQPAPSSLSNMTKMPMFNPVLGLTEVGTARYVAIHYPDRVNDVLRSVANPGEAKSYRKSLLLEAAGLRLGLPARKRADPPTVGLHWGSNIAADFLAPYLIKTVGYEAVQATYQETLPVDLIDMADRLDLTFYERFNSNFYIENPIRDLREAVTRMTINGIMPYTSTDYKDFSKVAMFLRTNGTQPPDGS